MRNKQILVKGWKDSKIEIVVVDPDIPHKLNSYICDYVPGIIDNYIKEHNKLIAEANHTLNIAASIAEQLREYSKITQNANTRK